MRPFSMSLLAACTVLLACGRSSPDAARSASSSSLSTSETTQPKPAAAPSAADSLGAPCPRTGRWALCSVEKRLVQSGFVVRRVEGERPRRAGFSVLPVVYALGRSRLEVFIYPDEAALSREVTNIDTLTASPRGAPTPWDMTPTFVRSANLAAVFLTDSQQQAERLTLAITAGAPQP